MIKTQIVLPLVSLMRAAAVRSLSCRLSEVSMNVSLTAARTWATVIVPIPAGRRDLISVLRDVMMTDEILASALSFMVGVIP